VPARGVPEEVLLALFDAVKADSEEPLERLPAEWSTRTIEAFRECRVAWAKRGPPCRHPLGAGGMRCRGCGRSPHRETRMSGLHPGGRGY
jgi:hypothetical protein